VPACRKMSRSQPLNVSVSVSISSRTGLGVPWRWNVIRYDSVVENGDFQCFRWIVGMLEAIKVKIIIPLHGNV